MREDVEPILLDAGENALRQLTGIHRVCRQHRKGRSDAPAVRGVAASAAGRVRSDFPIRETTVRAQTT